MLGMSDCLFSHEEVGLSPEVCTPTTRYWQLLLSYIETPRVKQYPAQMITWKDGGWHSHPESCPLTIYTRSKKIFMASICNFPHATDHTYKLGPRGRSCGKMEACKKCWSGVFWQTDSFGKCQIIRTILENDTLQKRFWFHFASEWARQAGT